MNQPKRKRLRVSEKFERFRKKLIESERERFHKITRKDFKIFYIDRLGKERVEVLFRLMDSSRRRQTDRIYYFQRLDPKFEP